MARYQYETSPRKLEPDYTPNRKRKTAPQKKSKKQEQIRQKAKQNVKANQQETRKKAKVMCYVVLIFGVLLAISYRNSLITENFAQIRNLKSNLAAVQKENEQLEVNIESSLNLKNVEKIAQETLGMQRLTNSQKVYISLPKKDYVEPAAEQVQMSENQGLLQKFLGLFQTK